MLSRELLPFIRQGNKSIIREIQEKQILDGYRQNLWKAMQSQNLQEVYKWILACRDKNLNIADSRCTLEVDRYYRVKGKQQCELETGFLFAAYAIGNGLIASLLIQYGDCKIESLNPKELAYLKHCCTSLSTDLLVKYARVNEKPELLAQFGCCDYDNGVSAATATPARVPSL